MGIFIAYKIVEFIASLLHISNFTQEFPPLNLNDIGNVAWYSLVFLMVCGAFTVLEYIGAMWAKDQSLFFLEYPLIVASWLDAIIAVVCGVCFFGFGFIWVIFTVGNAFSKWFFTPWF